VRLSKIPIFKSGSDWKTERFSRSLFSGVFQVHTTPEKADERESPQRAHGGAEALPFRTRGGSPSRISPLARRSSGSTGNDPDPVFQIGSLLTNRAHFGRINRAGVVSESGTVRNSRKLDVNSFLSSRNVPVIEKITSESQMCANRLNWRGDLPSDQAIARQNERNPCFEIALPQGWDHTG